MSSSARKTQGVFRHECNCKQAAEWLPAGCVADVHMRVGNSCRSCEARPPFGDVAPVSFVDVFWLLKPRDPVKQGATSVDGQKDDRDFDVVPIDVRGRLV